VNLVAARVGVTPAASLGSEPFFHARLDALHEPLDNETPINVVSRPVTRKAAVCDLCAEQPAGPACIRACPHDAAWRVDARAGMPN
jgi:Fe-S-cluster-containing hydrogenase component 2